jgi:hypothetical protein
MRIDAHVARACVGNFLFERAPGSDAMPPEDIGEAAAAEKLPLKVCELGQLPLYI